MPVEDVFSITGRGTVATGRVERGQVRVGDEVEIVGISEETSKTTVTGVEMFRKLLDYAEAGTTLVRYYVVLHVTTSNVDKFLLKPGTITPHTKFKAEVYVLTKERGWTSHSISSLTTVLNSTSVQQTSLVFACYQKVLKW